jgi:hypothetical protein
MTHLRWPVFGWVGAGVATCVGVFGPWAHIATLGFDGTQGRAGWVVFAAGLGSLALLVAAVTLGEAWLAAIAAIPAAAAGAVAGIYATNPDRWLSVSDHVAAVGWGAVVSAAGGGLLTLAALLQGWRLRASARERPRGPVWRGSLLRARRPRRS